VASLLLISLFKLVLVLGLLISEKKVGAGKVEGRNVRIEEILNIRKGRGRPIADKSSK
jgi:hypothetical protein